MTHRDGDPPPICKRCDVRPRVLRKTTKHPSGTSGRFRAYCRECEAEMARERMRIYYATPEGKAKVQARVAAWQKATPERHRAYMRKWKRGRRAQNMNG